MGLLQFVRKRRTWTNVTRCIILLMAVLHNCRHVVQHCWVQMSAKLIMRQLLRMRMHLIRTVRMIKAVRCRQHIPMTHSMNLIVLLCNWIHFPKFIYDHSTCFNNFHSNEKWFSIVMKMMWRMYVCVTKETYDDIKRNAKAPMLEALN